MSNHGRLDCLLNRLFRRRSKETSKFCVTGLVRGIRRNYHIKIQGAYWSSGYSGIISPSSWVNSKLFGPTSKAVDIFRLNLVPTFYYDLQHLLKS